jgi:hypothetical protein
VLPQMSTGDKVGLCAFGGGFTFGAAILEVLPKQQTVAHAA